MANLCFFTNRQIVLCITFCLGFISCSAPPDEASQIRANLSAMAKAAEHKDSRELLTYLTADFVAHQGWRKPQMFGIVYGYFQQNPVITVTLMDTEVSVQGDSARSHGRLLLTGGEQVLPERMRWLDVELNWVRRDSQWKIHKATWHNVGSESTVSGT